MFLLSFFGDWFYFYFSLFISKIVNCLFDITKEERKLEDQIAECEKEISENEDFQQELKKEFKDKEKEEDDNKAELEGLLKDHKELNRKSAKLRRKLDEQGL